MVRRGRRSNGNGDGRSGKRLEGEGGVMGMEKCEAVRRGRRSNGNGDGRSGKRLEGEGGVMGMEMGEV